MMSPMSAEATVVRNYIDWILALPWDDKTEDQLRHQRGRARSSTRTTTASKKVKERILEYLAVQALVEQAARARSCASSARPASARRRSRKSIARATGRKFVRLSLGGVRDEAEIRGHRRTYIGALPGKIIQSLKKAGSNNPVFLLDEIDKMSMDFRGDPSAALLEVLDPEQNHTFNDHYLDLDYDLSRRDVHHAPRTRCTRSRCRCRTAWRSSSSPATPSGRSSTIAQQYLIPKQTRGERPQGRRRSTFTDERDHARSSTTTRSEAGVRNLEREIATRVPQDARKECVEGGRTTHDVRGHADKRAEATSASPKYRCGAARGGRRDRPRATASPSPMFGGDLLADRGHGRARQGQADAHRQARRGDAGVGAGGDELRALARRARSASIERLLRARSTSTSTSPRARSRRTARPRASRWRPRWRRALHRASRCAQTSR